MKSLGPYREPPKETPHEALSPTDVMVNIMLKVPLTEMHPISWKIKIAIASVLLTLGTVIGSANRCTTNIPNHNNVPAASDTGN